MTREEFMMSAKADIEKIFYKQRNAVMNIVEQTWAEGKKHAENEYLEKVSKDLLENIEKAMKPEDITITNKDIGNIPTESFSKSNGIPDVCKNCPNHPSNGGNGVCMCTAPYITS